MELHPNHPTHFLRDYLSPSRPERAMLSNEAGFSLEEFQALRRELEAADESRPEEVARGEALAASPDYPPAEIVARLAGFFAGQWTENGEPGA